MSPGVFDPKHFAGVLGSPCLLYLKIAYETRFGTVAWRRGAWVTSEQLARETGRSSRTIREWLAALERDGSLDGMIAGGYLRIERGKRGLRIELSRRRWYSGGQPRVTLASGENSPVVGGISPGVGEILPDVGEIPPDRRSEAATGAGFVIPSSENLSVKPSSGGAAASRSPDGARGGPLADPAHRPDFREQLAEAELAGDEKTAGFLRGLLAYREKRGLTVAES